VTVPGRGGGEGARTRDHLANVRTTLTWLRTGVILMAAGCATDKVAALDRVRGGSDALRSYGRPLGLLAVVAGVALAAATLPRFLRARARIESDRFDPGPGLDLALIAALGLGAAVVLVLLAMTR
jgi:uncharacterized membrane protein YidH (DUF202 family)